MKRLYLPVCCILMLWALLPGVGSELRAQAPDWTLNPADFETSMTVIGTLEFDGTTSDNTDDIVAAFVGDDVRGLASPSSSGSSTTFLMLVLGNSSDDEVSFKVYDASLNTITELDLTIEFESNGTVGSFSSPVRYVVERSLPQTPTLSLPANAATSVSTEPTFAWGTTEGAMQYDLLVSTQSDFSVTVISESGLSEPTFEAVGLAENTTYYWRVRGANTAGFGSWSTVRSFTTQAGLPGTIQLLLPANGSSPTDAEISLSWLVEATSMSYDIQVSTQSDFLTVDQAYSGVTVTSQVLSGLVINTIYYWRVRGSNGSGAGEWSSAFSFTRSAPGSGSSFPGTPFPMSPTNGASVMGDITFDWLEAARVSYYELQISTSELFSDVEFATSNIQEASVTVTTVTDPGTYFWRVRGINNDGAGSWSTVNSFKIQLPIPAIPEPGSPSNGATGLETSVSLSWGTATGATSYELMLATDASFQSGVQQFTVTGATEFTVTALQEGTTYYWRIRGVNDQWSGSWSDTLSFATRTNGSDTPTLLAPANGAINQADRLWLSWLAADNATEYRVQISTVSDFSSIVADVNVSSITVYELTGLAPGTTYFWRVRGANSSGFGSWSDYFQFTTGIPAPGIPEPTAPADGALNTAIEVSLTWQSPGAGVTFDVQISTTNTFSSLLIDRTGISETTHDVGPLPNSTQLFWRVRAVNAGGHGAWSPVHSFTTVAAISAAPTLLLPENNAVDQPSNLFLLWQATAGATAYHVQLATDIAFTNLIADDPHFVGVQQVILPVFEAGATYFWRVRGRDGAELGPWSDVFQFTTAVATHNEDPGLQPVEFALLGNYPNPFNPTTRIEYTIPRSSVVRIDVIDSSGRLIDTLVDARQAAGKHAVTFQAGSLPSGVYSYRLTAGKNTSFGRLVLLK